MMQLGRALRFHDHPRLISVSAGETITIFSPPVVTEVEGVWVGPGARRKLQFWEESASEIARGLQDRGVTTIFETDPHRQGSETWLSFESLGESQKKLTQNFTAFKKSLPPALLHSAIETTKPAPGEGVLQKNGEYLWRGGETAALQHWHHYVWELRGLDHYKATRNGLRRVEDSAKISPWLACGALSARALIGDVQRYESQYGASESTRAFVDEILWRDYFKHLARHVGPRFYTREGLSSKVRSWSQDRAQFRLWALGQTGEPFVDAGMRELWWTGWMSNRLRQNVASYLSKTLGLDWTWGARWFEAHLIDEDPECNWGNWLYNAGVGTDPRDRTFNVQRQAEMYDPHGEYQSLWADRPVLD